VSLGTFVRGLARTHELGELECMAPWRILALLGGVLLAVGAGDFPYCPEIVPSMPRRVSRPFPSGRASFTVLASLDASGFLRTAAALPCELARVGVACLRLRGGGKFSLQRMMKITLDRLPAEERARVFDKLHKSTPGLDEGDDRYARELRRFRQRWEANEEDTRRRAHSAELAKREKVKGRAEARQAAAKQLVAKLPPLTGDAGSVAHALEPYVRGDLGNVQPRDCVPAILRLQSLLAQGACSVGARRACLRVRGALLRRVGDAIATCADLEPYAPIVSMLADASRLSAIQGTSPQSANADDDSAHVLASVVRHLASCAKLPRQSRKSLEQVTCAAALGAGWRLSHFQSRSDVSSSPRREVVRALQVLAPHALQLPVDALSLPTVEALLVLCSLGVSEACPPTRQQRAVWSPPLLLHLLAAAQAHVSQPPSVVEVSAGTGVGGEARVHELGRWVTSVSNILQSLQKIVRLACAERAVSVRAPGRRGLGEERSGGAAHGGGGGRVEGDGDGSRLDSQVRGAVESLLTALGKDNVTAVVEALRLSSSLEEGSAPGRRPFAPLTRSIEEMLRGGAAATPALAE